MTKEAGELPATKFALSLVELFSLLGKKHGPIHRTNMAGNEGIRFGTMVLLQHLQEGTSSA
jgi:hypothetical protein